MSTIDVKVPSVSGESKTWAVRFWELGKAAEDLLRRSAYLELSNISCDFHEGVLTLRGRVPSYHLKQLAQSSTCELEGVVEVNNQLDVVAPRDVRQSNCGPVNADPSPRRYV